MDPITEIVKTIQSLSKRIRNLETSKSGGSSAAASANHSKLLNLSYSSSGHTGFEPAKGADDNYVTDAQLIVIQNTSGVNTGDDASDGTYLRLDGSNDPVYGDIQIRCDSIESLAIYDTQDFLVLSIDSIDNQVTIQAKETQTNLTPLLLLRDYDYTDLLSLNTDHISNIFLGLEAGISNVVDIIGDLGLRNVYIGYQAATGAISGLDSIAIGYQASPINIQSRSIFIGSQVAASSGFAVNSDAIAIGYKSMYEEVSSGSIGIGTNSLYDTSIGRAYATIAIGIDSCKTPSGSIVYSIGIGSGALKTGKSKNSIAIGLGALEVADSSDGYNIGIGDYVLEWVGAGGDNIAIGRSTAQSCSGSQNIAIGRASYGDNHDVSSGSFNVMIGCYSGRGLLLGSKNIFIGQYAGSKQTSVSDLLVIDDRIRASAAEESTNAILYGTMADLPADQLLTINAVTTVNGDITADNLSGTNTGDQVGDGVSITGTGTIADPFVSAGGAVVADGTTITGTGTALDPLVAVQQVGDGITITGTGTALDPFVSAGGTPPVVDGVTITGAGTALDPFVATQQVGDGITITGTGTVADPFVSVSITYDVVYSEVIADTGTEFFTADSFLPGTLRVYLNGVRQDPSEYTEKVGLDGFDTDFSVTASDILTVDYDVVSGAGGGIEEAPITGDEYVRKNAGWEIASGGGDYLDRVFTPPILTGFTWVNQDTATATQEAKYVLMARAEEATNEICLLKKALPYSTEYMITMGVTSSARIAYNRWGIALKDASSGKIIGCNFMWADGKIKACAHTWVDETTWDASSIEQDVVGTPNFLRIIDDGTQYIYQFSYDGINFSNFWIDVDKTSYLAEADEFGFFIEVENDTYGFGTCVFHFSIEEI